MSKKANTLSIRLTESAVFLPTDGAPRRRVSTVPDNRNAMLRGLLILELVKPTKISSIEVELSAVTSTAWPEGIGARRIDVTEEHRVFQASTTYFNGSKTPASRRTASIGPGVAFSRTSQSPHTDEEIGNDYDSELEDTASHYVRPEDDGAGRSRSTSRAGAARNRSNRNSLPHGYRAPEPQAGPSNYGQSQLVYSNQPSSQPLQRGDSAPTNRSRNSFPSRDSWVPMSRRMSLDSSQFQRNPIYETYHEQDEADEAMRDEREKMAPIPPYSPYPPDSPPASAPVGSPVGPAQQSLEEFRNSLHSNLRSSFHQSQTSLRSGSPHANSAQSLRERSRSRRPSVSDMIPENDEVAGHTPRFASPSRPQRSDSGSNSRHASRSRPRSRAALPLPMALDHPSTSSIAHNHQPETLQHAPSGHDHERGRKGSRFSLSAVSTIFMDAVRSSSPKTARVTASQERRDEIGDRRERSVDVVRGVSQPRGRGRTVERDQAELVHPDSPQVQEPKERGRGVISKMLKDRHKDKESGKTEGWKEFKKGTYTYPISFSIPSDAPPTMQCDYGAVNWRLKANVHRPGTFKSKMTATRDVITIACPTEEDTEDTENIIVERHWEQQLQYLISVSGRSFYIGGTMPVTITLMPLAKIKVHRLSIYIEERVDYYTHMRRIARTDPVTRFCLLSVKNDGKGSEHILPLESDCPDALRNSPLFSVLEPNLSDAELSEATSNLMGPGPWTFHQELSLPNSCDQLRFTNRNRRSNITVTHTLKVVMRVERGDDLYVDKTGKRKLFDIVVQTPVLILSCRCNPEWTSLPRYAEAFDDSTSITPSCPCQVARARLFGDQSPGFRPAVTAALERMTSRHSTDSSAASAAETSPINGSAMRSLRQMSYNESILRSSSLFERLISGQETETGENPPAYDSALSPFPVVETIPPIPLGAGVSVR